MPKSNVPLIIGGVAVAGGAAYLIYRKTHPVVDVEHKTNSLVDAARAACIASAMATGVPAPLATLGCAAGGALLKPLGKVAKKVGKTIVKHKKTIALGIATGGAHTAVKLGIKAIKKLPKPVKKVGKTVALGIATGGIHTTALVAGKVLKKIVPKSIKKVAGKVFKAPIKLAGKVVGAPVKAVKKIGKFLGLGDGDMDLAAYASHNMMGVGGKRRARGVPRSGNRVRRKVKQLAGLADCGGGADCCQSLRNRMPGVQFYESGFAGR